MDIVSSSTKVDINDTYNAAENNENQYTKLDYALDAAAKGYPVFPMRHPIFTEDGANCSCRDPKCEDIGKHPIFSGWRDVATTDEGKIRELWGHYPEANLGTPTGAEFGLVVVDEDTEDATRAAAKLGYDDGPVVKTGRGLQRHFYPAGLKIKGTVGKVAPGLDTRGEGGLCILLGSVHYSGKVYEWEVEPKGSRPAAPGWLPEKTVLRDMSFDMAAAMEGTSEGSRNDTAASVAGKLRNAGVPIEVAEAMIVRYADNCEPPMEHDEALAVLESVYRYPEGTYQVSPLSPSPIGEGHQGHLTNIGQGGFIRMSEQVPSNRPREFVIEGLVPKRYATILYGDGGVAKSLNLVHQLMCIARGDDWHGKTVVQSPVAYLDFELDAPEQVDRVHAVAKGMGVGVPDNFWYRSAAGVDVRIAFQQALDFCVKNGIGVLGIDSVGMAVTGNSESAADVLKFFKTFVDPFRAQEITLIMVDHQSKMQAGERYQNKTIFGSAYKSHSVRSSIQVEVRERVDDVLKLTFRHKKTNFGQQQDPFGVKVTFKKFDETTLEPDELSNAELAEEGTVNASDRILRALEDGPMYPADIAEATTLAPKTVKNKLTDLRKAGKVENTGNQSGQSMEVSLVSPTHKGRGREGHLEPYLVYGSESEQEIEEVI
jgi:DNA-binding transcriptional ArsR family regulator